MQVYRMSMAEIAAEAEAQRRERAAISAVSSRTAGADTLGSFEATVSPALAARARQYLNRVIFINGRPQAVRLYIESAVKQGATVATNSEGRVLAMPNGTYMRQRDIGKFALDYAAHLIGE